MFHDTEIIHITPSLILHQGSRGKPTNSNKERRVIRELKLFEQLAKSIEGEAP